MESIWGVHEQVGEQNGKDPSEEITAVLLKEKESIAHCYASFSHKGF